MTEVPYPSQIPLSPEDVGDLKGYADRCREKLPVGEGVGGSPGAAFEEGWRALSIIMREISEAEKQRILDSLTDKRERILFGLEPPEEPGRRREQIAKSGGNLVCDICDKGGLTKRGLALHKARIHKASASEAPEAEDVAPAGDLLGAAGESAPSRR